MDLLSLVIIGAGPAGAAAALEAAKNGVRVTLIGAEAVGGRATWHSLLPSKIHLTAADLIFESKRQAQLGLSGSTPTPDLSAIRERIAQQKQAWSSLQSEQLQSLGAVFMPGKAAFVDKNHIRVIHEDKESILKFDRAVIASGSVPVFPPKIKPDGKRILAPRFASQLQTWPEKVIVVGGGVTGSEFVYLFNSMGSQVTWVTDLPSLLPRTDEDVSRVLEEAFTARGVEIFKSSPVESVESDGSQVSVTLKNGKHLIGSHAFIAIGRRGDIDELNLEAAGISADRKGVLINEFCQTSQAHIYAVGDAGGPPFLANRGLGQARAAVKHALGLSGAAYNPLTTVEAIYTEPQAAQVGYTERAAAEAGIAVYVQRMNYQSGLKPLLMGTGEGFVKLLSSPQTGIILGASAVGSHAADVLAPAAAAIQGQLTIDQLADIFPAYPTLSELIFCAARGYS